MINKPIDVKLNVRPVCFGLVHRYAYEGPCRFASGDALTRDYDEMAAQQVFANFKEEMANNLPSSINVMEPLYFECFDDWIMPQAMFDKMDEDLEKVDVYLVHTGIAREKPIIELAERTDKPIICAPSLGCIITAVTGSLLARGKVTYPCVTWADINQAFTVLRAYKAYKKTNVLLASRFNSNTSYALNDSFISLQSATDVFGARFRYMDIHELMDCMEPLPETGGNHTTPLRRDTPNVTAKDMEAAEQLADELLAGADKNNCDVERKFLVKSCLAHVLVKKLLDIYDCNCFSIPCPDLCSTTRIHQMQFTFCLNHSLCQEQGIMSTCDYDVNSMFAMVALAVISNKSPYLGNAMPMRLDQNGRIIAATRFDADKDLAPDVDRHNLYLIDHSTPTRYKEGYDRPCSPYGLRHFAFDAKFGAVLRYDHSADVGKTITMCRYSPDIKKMLIGKGTIVGGGGYDKDNCNNYVIFRVNSQKQFLNAHKYAGNHLPLVYGDYTEELTMLAELLGVEAMVV